MTMHSRTRGGMLAAGGLGRCATMRRKTDNDLPEAFRIRVRLMFCARTASKCRTLTVASRAWLQCPGTSSPHGHARTMI